MKIVHFGAGNIGRGAIPEIFKNIYTKIVFIDPNTEIVNKLNEISEYKIINKNSMIVNNYKAICSNDVKSILEEIKDADLITTSCGINNLDSVSKILDMKIDFVKKPIVIAFENNIRPSTELKKITNNKDNYIFLDCTIDRIIPKQNIVENSLDIFSETYLSVVIENIEKIKYEYFKNCLQVDNLDKYISLKLFGVNGIHFILAILTFSKCFKYIHNFSDDKEILNKINIFKKYLKLFLINNFSFDKKYIDEYIEKNIDRFLNKDLNDECSRVARNALLKLSYENRVIPIFKYFFEKINNEDSNLMKEILIELISYNNLEDQDSIKMQEIIKNNGIEKSIKLITNLDLNN